MVLNIFQRKPTPGPGQIATVQFPLTVGLIVGGAVVIFVLAYWFLPDYRLLIIFSAAAIGGGAAVTSAYYATKALAVATEQGAEKVERKNILAAFEYMQRWNDPAFSRTRKDWRTLIAEVRGKSGDEIWNLVSNDHAKRSTVLDVLNHLEELGLAVKHRTADEEVLKDYFRFIVADYFSVFQGWVEKLRIVHTYPGAYEQLQWLRDRWR